ncbi:MAG: hypothetical protein KC636_38615 [Myxococcales bacterium]|nr:hypothetical protein [Myxococcales bacterium]
MNSLPVSESLLDDEVVGSEELESDPEPSDEPSVVAFVLLDPSEPAVVPLVSSPVSVALSLPFAVLPLSPPFGEQARQTKNERLRRRGALPRRLVIGSSARDRIKRSRTRWLKTGQFQRSYPHFEPAPEIVQLLDHTLFFVYTRSVRYFRAHPAD